MKRGQFCTFRLSDELGTWKWGPVRKRCTINNSIAREENHRQYIPALFKIFLDKSTG
jgi:hypothetical protein